MGLDEDMRRQKAALDAQARERAQREQANRESVESGKAFLSDFVREAQARGIPKSWKHCTGSYYQKPEKWWKAETLVQKYVYGWVVYARERGGWIYAIGEDAALYENFGGPDAHIVDEGKYVYVPWQKLTQVLLGQPPAFEPWVH